MGQTTPLIDAHRRAGAKLVEFAGWEMPLHYGSQIEEHHAVRRNAGMFDVSHMARVDLLGPGVRAFLRNLLANDVAKIAGIQGRALYSCLLNEQGGVKDDLIVYFINDEWFRLVVNAATSDKDLAWIAERAGAGVDIEPRPDLAMIAVQGPSARERTLAVLGPRVAAAAADLKPFHSVEVGEYFVACTGYTGEDGYELIVPNERAVPVWSALAEAGVVPCGLGARDTLRLEAGMNLYGADMDETTTPLESGLAWTVAWQPVERAFVGRTALERQRSDGVRRKLVGLVLDDRGVLRAHQTVHCDEHGPGEITSGTFSPTLRRSIALARVPVQVELGDRCQVDIRGKRLTATVVKYPFVRNGRSLLDG